MAKRDGFTSTQLEKTLFDAIRPLMASPCKTAIDVNRLTVMYWPASLAKNPTVAYRPALQNAGRICDCAYRAEHQPVRSHVGVDKTGRNNSP